VRPCLLCSPACLPISPTLLPSPAPAPTPGRSHKWLVPIPTNTHTRSRRYWQQQQYLARQALCVDLFDLYDAAVAQVIRAWCEEGKDDWACTHIGWRPLRTASALSFFLLHFLVSPCVPPPPIHCCGSGRAGFDHHTHGHVAPGGWQATGQPAGKCCDRGAAA